MRVWISDEMDGCDDGQIEENRFEVGVGDECLFKEHQSRMEKKEEKNRENPFVIPRRQGYLQRVDVKKSRRQKRRQESNHILVSVLMEKTTDGTITMAGKHFLDDGVPRMSPEVTQRQRCLGMTMDGGDLSPHHNHPHQPPHPVENG